MKSITSKDNQIYKSALRLTRKKYRDAEGMYLLEGVKPLEDAVAQGIHVEKLIISGNSEAKSGNSEAKSIGIISGDADADMEIVQLEPKLFAELSDTETSQGVIAVVRKNSMEPAEFMEAAKGRPIVILDRLQDPGNIGTIIRTAEAAGFGGIIGIKGTGDIYSPKVVRAAAGSILRMPILEGVETAEAIELCRAGRQLVVSCLEGAVDYREAKLDGDIALVVGNEGSGAGEELIAAADTLVKIPMEGEIESLNAAVAAGILMYAGKR